MTCRECGERELRDGLCIAHLVGGVTGFVVPSKTAAHFGITTVQVCQTVGVTYRQLDYWVRTGVVTPSKQRAEGSGTAQIWTEADIDRVRVVKGLLDHGMSLQRVRKLTPEVRARLVEAIDYVLTGGELHG